MIRLSPRHLVAIAGTLVGLGAHPSHHAPGGYIARLHEVHASSTATAPVSWDVSLIQHCGYWSHFDYRCEQSAWPVRSAATSPELAAFGTEREVLREQPAHGDIFLQWAPRRLTFVHAGIVVAVLARGGYGSSAPYYDIATIEGDTDQHGRLGGGVTMRVKRRLSAAAGDRFLRWAELESFQPLGQLVDAGARRSA